MSKDMESLTKQLFGTAKSKGYDLEQISGIIDSPEGRALLAQLNGPGGEALKQAASKAAEGDTGALSTLMGALMSSKEGQSVAKQAMNLKKK